MIMKKRITVLLALAVLLTLAGCAGSGKKNEPAPEWTRTGYFEDENGTYLYVDKLEEQEDKGWYVL